MTPFYLFIYLFFCSVQHARSAKIACELVHSSEFGENLRVGAENLTRYTGASAAKTFPRTRTIEPTRRLATVG